MSDDSKEKMPIGTVAWIDLTVENAEPIRDFYRDVTGWECDEFPMGEKGEYNDYIMKPPGGSPITGICHAMGDNKNIPPGWILYIVVENVELASARCVSLGGKIIDGPRKHGDQGTFCIIRDPAGCLAALYSETV